MTSLTKRCVCSLIVFGALTVTVTPVLAIDVLYVLGGDQAANGLSNPGDILLNDFFVGRGDTVMLLDQGAAAADMLAASDAAGLTYISESVGSGNVTNKVTASTTPVITSEAFLQDDLLYTLNDDCCRQNVDGTEIEILDPGHPLAAGLSGVVANFGHLGRIGWGMPTGDAQIAASLPGAPTQATIYGYSAGAALNDGSAAAANRVFIGSATGLTLPDPTGANPTWTPDGEALFAAAVNFALPAAGGFVKVDDFESYTLGAIDGQSDGSGTWSATAEYEVAVDPTNASNQVLNVLSAAPTVDAFNNDPALTIADGTTGTLFMRFRAVDPARHVNWGLSDMDMPGGDFPDFEAQLRNQNGLDVRNGGGFTSIDPDNPLNEWLNVWMVINNDTDMSEVYLQSDVTYPTQTQLMADGGETSFAFRNGTADPLLTLFFRNSGDHVGPWYLDDVYLDPSGANLTNPIPEPSTVGLAALALVSLLGFSRRRGVSSRRI